MRTELCPNCFEAGYQNGGCTRCGYQLQYDQHRSGMVLPAGTVVNGRYYIGKVLGEGGFGITYKAYDMQRRSVCAIKEYAPNGLVIRSENRRSLDLTSHESEQPYMAGLRRFLEEAQVLSRLEQIPSVVNIMDTFQENNTAYFAMEFLDGADLRQIVRASQQRMASDWITQIILQVALSMDVIHTKTKIIHRDISPENIYITRDGRVKLIDFGSAKQTESGMKKGLSVVLKPKFAPPEQFSSQMVQGSFTDVYALAGTYYYALTGVNLPSAPDRLMGTSYVPLKMMNVGISDQVSDAVDRALFLNVNQRTRTMQAFVQEIVSGMNLPVSQTPPRQPVQQPMQGQSVPQRTPGQSAPQRTSGQPVVQRTPGQPMTPQTPRQPMAQRAPRQKMPPSQPAAAPCVKVVAGAEKGKNWIIPPNQTMTFGRSSEAFLRISQPEEVSRMHCEITYLSSLNQYRIRDTSANGVFYSGQRLQKGVDYHVKPPARFMLSSAACIIELGVKYEHR